MIHYDAIIRKAQEKEREAREALRPSRPSYNTAEFDKDILRVTRRFCKQVVRRKRCLVSAAVKNEWDIYELLKLRGFRFDDGEYGLEALLYILSFSNSYT